MVNMENKKTESNFEIIFKNFCNQAFNKILPHEQLSFFLHSEESVFIRFNQSKVRQNTLVHQHELSVQYFYNKNQKKIKITETILMTQDPEMDLRLFEQCLNSMREQALTLPSSQDFTELKNSGISSFIKKVHYPSSHEIVALIDSLFNEKDMTGFWCSGPLRNAQANSLGQWHFYEVDHFFFDYSVYQDKNASKGYYSSDHFNLDEFKKNITNVFHKLNAMSKPKLKIPVGTYDVYLEPMAVLEIFSTMTWSSFSFLKDKMGLSPLNKLATKQNKLNSKFTLIEDFKLNVSPQFNSMGEISKDQIHLFKDGEFITYLISSISANEFNVQSLFAETNESPRSLYLLSGQLPTAHALQKLDRGLYLSNLHYINYSDIESARLTGMTRFACFWVENGIIQSPIEDLRFDESFMDMFSEKLIDFTQESELFLNTSTYNRRQFGGMKVPGALIKDFQFTL